MPIRMAVGIMTRLRLVVVEMWRQRERRSMVLGRAERLVVIALVLASTGCAVIAPTAPPPSPTPTSDSVLPTPSDPPPTSVLPSPTPEPPLAARVNGEPIYLADYEQRLDRFRATLTAQGIDPDSEEGQAWLDHNRDEILDAMIEQTLVEQTAEEAGIEVTDADVERTMQDMIAEAGGEEAFRARLATWGETYESAEREVRAQLMGRALAERAVSGVPQSAEHIRARHIVVDTAETARHIHAQLKAGADFADLARAHSQDSTTRDTGGDLGSFPRGILLASEVEEAAFSLQPGQFSDVVPSGLGYHIVLVVERDPDRAISPKNLQFLRERALEQWIETLWAQAQVERFVGASP